MSEVLDDRQIFVIANDYGMFPADLLYENRVTDTEGTNFCSLANRSRSTGILILYDADELDYPN